MRLLFVDDDKLLAKAMKRGLEAEQYAVDLAPDGEEGLYFANNCPYDLILLDRRLPDMDGLEILQKIRQQKIETPVVMLTGMAAITERVEGFMQGADDYLVKPFAFEELLVRIKSLIRRKGGRFIENRVILNDLVIDLNEHSVELAGKSISLTNKEFSLLEYLLHQKGRVVTRTELVEHLYDETFDKDSNLIDVFIHKLRRKFGPAARMIQTRRGRGYIFKDAT